MKNPTKEVAMTHVPVGITAMTLLSLLLGGCGPDPRKEPIQTTQQDECTGSVELQYSRYGGFQIRVSPCQGKELWSPVLYGENERVVTREIDAVLKKFKFRCSINTHTGQKSGRSRRDAECQRIP
jgi:hypothetical protein